MKLTELDQAARHAWPALEEQQLPFGVLRYAQGVNRRCNSLNVFPEALYSSHALIDAAESYFRSKAQPSIVRVLKLEGSSSAAFASLDGQLQDSGYQLQGQSQLMVCEPNGASVPVKSVAGGCFQSCGFQQWLPAWHALNGRGAEELRVHESTLAKIKHPAKFLLLKNIEGKIVCCGMAVLSNRALGIFAIASGASDRNKGYGRTLMQALIAWGLSRSARCIYLQVESSNTPACDLYRSMGFKELYSYWYRVKKLSNS